MARKPWFLVMTAADANQPGSEWTRVGVSSGGKVVARPIAPEGWLALLGFVVLISAVPLLIWLTGFVGGRLSLVEAVVLTVLVVAAIVGGFIWLIRSRCTRLPPHPPT